MGSHFRKAFCLVICAVLISLMLPINVEADMGPKPSVHVIFKNMDERKCYGTLLSNTPSAIFYSVWDGSKEYDDYNYSYYNISEKVWRAFTEYSDIDGYYFLQEAIWKIDEINEIEWTYAPPKSFKILLYYPEYDKFMISDIYERYAFDTYYTVDMKNVEPAELFRDSDSSFFEVLNAYKSYPWQIETLSLAVRIILTILIEMGIAFLFGFRSKKALRFILMVNVSTQVLLNVLLNVAHYTSGELDSVRLFFVLEPLIFIIESLLYSTLLRKLTEKKKRIWFYVSYALISNVASFGVGMLIANILPGLF